MSLRALPALVALLCTSACSRPSSGQGQAEAVREAELVWSDRCSLCHGAAGKGDGPKAEGLSPGPRDLSASSWQRSASDERIRKVIVSGGPAVGLDRAMPGAPDLAGRPEVLTALVAKVRGLERR